MGDEGERGIGMNLAASERKGAHNFWCVGCGSMCAGVKASGLIGLLGAPVVVWGDGVGWAGLGLGWCGGFNVGA